MKTTDQKRRHGNPKVLLCTGFLILLVFVINTSFRLPLGSRNDGSISTTHHQRMGKSLSLEEHCQSTLDTLDATFDARRQARQTYEANHRFGVALPGSKTYFDVFEPEAVCFSEERFGGRVRFETMGDGPKFVCGVDMIAQKQQQQQAHIDQPSCLVYSVGSNNDIEFEVAVKKSMPNCEIHTFDPTLATEFKGKQYATFHPWGFGVDGETVVIQNVLRNITFETQSFETIYKKLGHENRTLDILKIDCEGCEYTVMPVVFDAIARGDLQIDQIQIEIHSRSYGKLEPIFHGADNANMRIFHKERNSWGCDGYFCCEYALASQSFLRRANAQFVCGKETYSVIETLERSMPSGSAT